MDAARICIARFGETMKVQQNAGVVRGLEVLPRGVLGVWRPLIGVGSGAVDGGVKEWGGRLGVAEDEEKDLTEVHKEGLLGVDMDSALRYGSESAELLDALEMEAEVLLRESIIDINHWGYIIFRRKILQQAFHDPDTHYVALTALRNMLLHVSGSEKRINIYEMELLRFAFDVLGEDKNDKRVVAGRTLNGALVRNAGTQLARNLVQRLAREEMRARGGDRYRRGSGRGSGKYSSENRGWKECGRDSGWQGMDYDDIENEFLVLSREPDSESKGLRGKRLGGNTAACILEGDGAPVYWDNRYVLCGAPAKKLQPGVSPVDEKAVLLAALSVRQEMRDQDWEDASFYVRQLRKTDWEKILSVSRKVRIFRVPFQCIRGLPIIFGKDKKSMSIGQLTASPHLGLSARPDMFFTAVRVPRFRCMPDDLEPGLQISSKFFETETREEKRA